VCILSVYNVLVYNFHFSFHFVFFEVGVYGLLSVVLLVLLLLSLDLWFVFFVSGLLVLVCFLLGLLCLFALLSFGHLCFLKLYWFMVIGLLHLFIIWCFLLYIVS